MWQCKKIFALRTGSANSEESESQYADWRKRKSVFPFSAAFQQLPQKMRIELSRML